MRGLFSFVILIVAATCRGDVIPAAQICSKMLIQRDSEVLLNGSAEPGEKVAIKCSWLTSVCKITADAKGVWKTVVKTGSKGGPHSVVFRGKNVVEVNDILLGDVWVFAGKSELGRNLGGVKGASEQIKTANYPHIRFRNPAGKWLRCGPETAGEMNATAFYFAKRIVTAMGVPIGIVCGDRYGNMAIKGVACHDDKGDTLKRVLNRKGGDGVVLCIMQSPGNKKISPEIRERQLDEYMADPNLGFVISADICDANIMSFGDVGWRVALWALAEVYDANGATWQGPVCIGCKRDEDKLRAYFDHAVGGFNVKGSAVKGFEIAGEDGIFMPANVSTFGPSLVISHPKIKEPAVARYGWKNVPELNLYNKAGLPVSPFKTRK